MKIFLEGGEFDGQQRVLPYSCWGVDIVIYRDDYAVAVHYYKASKRRMPDGTRVFEFKEKKGNY